MIGDNGNSANHALPTVVLSVLKATNVCRRVATLLYMNPKDVRN